MQDAGGERVREMVEGEREEAEDLVLLLRAGHRQQVVRRIGCIDRVGNVVQVVALVAGFHPFR